MARRRWLRAGGRRRSPVRSRPRRRRRVRRSATRGEMAMRARPSVTRPRPDRRTPTCSALSARPRSGPIIAASNSRQSATDRAIGPAWSRLHDSGTMPRGRHVPEGGFDRRGATAGGGDAERSGGVAPGGGGHHASGQRSSGAAARPAGRSGQVPRIADLIGRTPGRELVGVEVTEQHYAGVPQAEPTRHSRSSQRRRARCSRP